MAWGFWTQLFGPDEAIARFTIEVAVTPGVDGSITNAAFANGNFWFDLSNSGSSYNGLTPTVTRSGNTVSWTWPGTGDGTGPARVPGIITMGTF